MQKLLRRLFAPSIFEDDEKTRTAQTLNVFGWVAFIVVFILFASRIVLGELTASSYLFFPVILIVLFVTQVLIRYGYVRMAGSFMVTMIWLALTIQASNSDGLRDVSILAYSILVLLAALLLGWRSGLGVGLWSGPGC